MAVFNPQKKEDVRKVEFYCHSELAEESLCLNNKCFKLDQHEIFK